MYQHISPFLSTPYSSDLCLFEPPVHRPTYLCVFDTKVPQVLSTVYYSVVAKTGVGHIDAEVACSVEDCKNIIVLLWLSLHLPDYVT